MQHEQTQEHLPHIRVGLGDDAALGDRASAGADFRQMLQDAIGWAATGP